MTYHPPNLSGTCVASTAALVVYYALGPVRVLLAVPCGAGPVLPRNKKKHALPARWIATAFLLFSSAARGSGADAVELGRKSVQAMAENRDKSRRYAFREYYVNRDFDKNGKETGRETQTWDVIGLEGSTYKKLVNPVQR